MSAQPHWIAQMYAGKAGRDHLGLGSVSSDQILPFLAPSINVLTLHPRYHSFYVFLLDEFWHTDRPRTQASFKAFFKPRDFIFSLGAHFCDLPEHIHMRNVVGELKTRPLALQKLPTYDTTTYYIKSDRGGYGLYYRTVMIDLDLVLPGGPGFPYDVDVMTETRGKALAEAFRQAIKDTVYYQHYFDKDHANIPIEVIRAYIRKACLCQLQTDQAPDRLLVRDLFLHASLDPDAPDRRQSTIRLFLDIADKTQGHPISQDTFRQLIYFGSASGDVRYEPRADLSQTAQFWRLYQAREYYAFALNGLWAHLCEWGEAQDGIIRPVALPALWTYLEHNLDLDGLAQEFHLPPPHLTHQSPFRALLNWLENLVGESGADFDSACTLDSVLHEHMLYAYTSSRDNLRRSQAISAFLLLLALLYLRFSPKEIEHITERRIMQMGGESRLSIQHFLTTLRSKLNSGPLTIGAVVHWLYRDYVIYQHQRIATGKLPENTFRFQYEGDGLRFYALERPHRFQDSRFDAISTTVREIGLTGAFGEANHPLTPAGRTLLLEGDLA